MSKLKYDQNWDKDPYEKFKPYQIEKEAGFENNGCYNSIVYLKGISEPMRGRAEIVIFRGDTIFLDKKDKEMPYEFPGGSFEKKERDHSKTAIRESREEVRINCRNVKYVDSYCRVMKEPHEWVKKNIPKNKQWKAYYTEIYIGEFDSYYNGKIAKADRDDMIKTAKFYKINEVYNMLRKEHRKAVDMYLNQQKGNQLFKDSLKRK